MEPTTTIYLYKSLVILAGLFFVYLGYKLFVKGITAPAGDMEVNAEGKGGIKLLKFAPGIFFALVGTVVVLVGVTRPFSSSTTNVPAEPREAGPAAATDSAAQEPPAGKGGGRGNGDQRGGGAAGGQTTTTICDTCDVR